MEEPINKPITKENILGKWKVYDRFPSLSTDCEKREYIIFNEDSTLYRAQCDTLTGKWQILGDTILEITFDSGDTYGSNCKCYFVAENKIKIEPKQKSMFWATYIKEE
jgi:hypothetical protein